MNSSHILATGPEVVLSVTELALVAVVHAERNAKSGIQISAAQRFMMRLTLRSSAPTMARLVPRTRRA
jgi:hypothetical protein